MIDLNCGSANSFCPGTLINIVCKTRNIYLIWNVPGYNEISFTSSDHVGTVVTQGPYTAELLVQMIDDHSVSKVSFVSVKSMSGSSISCTDGGDFHTQSCSIQLAG